MAEAARPVPASKPPLDLKILSTENLPAASTDLNYPVQNGETIRS